jgi:hypothetical protein
MATRLPGPPRISTRPVKFTGELSTMTPWHPCNSNYIPTSRSSGRLSSCSAVRTARECTGDAVTQPWRQRTVPSGRSAAGEIVHRLPFRALLVVGLIAVEIEPAARGGTVR